MDRYIDADVLLEDLKHVYCLSCKKVNTFFCWNTCNVSDIINDVLNYEPADVAPVVHAHWIEWAKGRAYKYTCSSCSFGTHRNTNFCPDCGAKMDEEINDA